ncbi:MAG: hypothetical protein WC223_01375 [Bacteroidales bacterium]|jgi:hypothetical protein
MNKLDIISIILTSSLLSSGLTGFLTWLIRKNDYKNEYYKELIRKRLEAYEFLENILGHLSITTYEENTKEKYHVLFVDKQLYAELFKQIAIALKFNLWISENTRKTLIKLNVFQIEIGNNVLNINIPNETIIPVAIENYAKICEIRKELRNNILDDFKNLHKVNFENLKAI